MNRIAILLCVIALAGCGSTSDIVRAGPGTYMISSGGGIYGQNPSDIRQEVYEQANAHCDEMGKTMVPVDSKERQYELGGHTANVSLTFKCQ